MAKFILEVSDEYIRKQAEPGRVTASVLGKANGMQALDVLFDTIAFNHIKNEIDKGTTEFNLSIDDMDDDGERAIFNGTLQRCGMMCMLKQRNEEKSQDEGKQE